MRFFSNDSNDSRDQSNVDVQTRDEQADDDRAHDEHPDHEHPDHVQSDPVAVPQQRSGSPWSDAPGASGDDTVADTSDTSDPSDTSDAELSDRERTDGTDEASDALDLPLDDKGSDVNTDTDVSTDTAVDTGAEPDDGASRTTTTYGPDGTVVTSEETDSEEIDSVTAAADADTEADVDRLDGDPALKDEGEFDAPQAVDPATDKPLDTDAPDAGETDSSETDTTTPDTVVAAVATPADTTAGADSTADADTTADTDTTADDDTTADTDTMAGAQADTDTPAADEPVPVPVPVGAADTATAAKPGSVTEPDMGSLFGEADAQSFKERWRDIQLRFVDSPRDAATDAAALVDEAVDKLTASLKAQKDTVSHDSDDTEQLRVALRAYREILTVVIGL